MSEGNDRIVRSKFRNYLINNCGLSYNTATNYIWAMNTLSKYLKTYNVIEGSIYDIKNIHVLLSLKTALSDSEFYSMVNKLCHSNITPSLRHYYDFMAKSPDSIHTSSSHTRVTFQKIKSA